MTDNEEPEEIKVILIGDSGVGKTNLINTSVGLEFEEDKQSTISGSCLEKIIEINNKKYSLNIWDTAGQEAYRGVTKLFFNGSQIIVLVYDITRHDSFKSLEEWLKICKEILNEEDCVYGIVGNKNDLYLDCEVKEEEIQKFAASINSSFRLVSAKTDPENFINYLIELVTNYKKLDRNEEVKYKVKLNNVNNNESVEKKSCLGCLNKKTKIKK